MRSLALLVLACAVHAAGAAGIDQDDPFKPANGVLGQEYLRHSRRLPAMDVPDSIRRSRLLAGPAYTSPLAQAIDRSSKKGAVDLGVEAYIEVLAQCQREQSPTLTVPFQRSDSQQSHCFRF
jgi:hypothetical protein